MRWVRDSSGRFPRRPHYEPDELERTCADLLTEMRTARALRDAGYPIGTDDLAVLVERHAELDLYADLSAEGSDVEAVTDFLPSRADRPRVRIAERLSGSTRYANRLRTTLAHELAHVVLHNFLWWFDQAPSSAETVSLSPRCGPRHPGVDWMEWQANYAAGALLMPASAITELFGHSRPTWLRSTRAHDRVRRTTRAFKVSAPAAQIRLQQLGYLTARPPTIPRSPRPTFARSTR